MLWYNQNDPEQGIQCYDKALALNPRHVQSFLTKQVYSYFRVKLNKEEYI